MLVQCPNCQTNYKVSDDQLNDAVPAFRCSRCKHTFELDGGQPEASSDSPESRSAAQNELSLPFAANADPIPTSPGHAPEEPGHGGGEAAEPNKKDHTDWAMRPDNQIEDKPFVFAESATSPRLIKPTPQGDFNKDELFRKLKYDVPEDTPKNITEISPYLDQHASIKPFLTVLGLLVIGFSLLTAISYARPETPETVLKKIPLIGATVLKNNHLKEGILLKSLSTGYQTIQGNREVFLVSGVALNQNPVVVREIQLTGAIYSDAGKELERQTIWVGNTLSPKIIRGMTLEDIPQLQELKPLKSFEIPPGDSVPFTIVFLKSTKNAREFSCEVTAAGGDV